MKHAQHAAHNPKMGLFRQLWWCYLKILKDLPTWLKLTTSLENDPDSQPIHRSDGELKEGIYTIYIYTNTSMDIF